MDLFEKLLDYRVEMADVRKDNLKLRDEVVQLKEQLKLKSQVVFERGINWIECDEMTKDKSKTPICPKCYATGKVVMRLSIENWDGGPGAYCPICKMVHRLR